MNTRVLRLQNGGFTLVDADMVDELMFYDWRKHSNGYVCTHKWDRVARKQSIKYLHRLVNLTPKGMHTDHIDGNKLNNTRANLRSCTYQQNMMAQKAQTRQKTSRFKGVCWNGRRWMAGIKIDQRRKHIGCFKNEIDAAKAYNAKAVELFGQFSNLNPV